jgi:hypothetical protein
MLCTLAADAAVEWEVMDGVPANAGLATAPRLPAVSASATVAFVIE